MHIEQYGLSPGQRVFFRLDLGQRVPPIESWGGFDSPTVITGIMMAFANPRVCRGHDSGRDPQSKVLGEFGRQYNTKPVGVRGKTGCGGTGLSRRLTPSDTLYQSENWRDQNTQLERR